MDDHTCLSLCLFAHACECRSPQAGTPELAYATYTCPCGIGCLLEPSTPGEGRDRGKGIELIIDRAQGLISVNSAPSLPQMARMSDVPPKGGFSFDLCRRNEMLLKKGIQLPSFRKTGTTIVGLVFQDGIVLGADTRATEGPIVADKNCSNRYGELPTSASPLCNWSRIKSHYALTLLKSHLFSYQGHISAALVLGGVDVTGPHLHTVYPHGSTDTLPFATMEGLTRDDGIQLVCEAICSGIFNDLGSGSNVDVCVITKGQTEYLRNHQLPNPRTYVSTKGYNFVKGHTEVLATKIKLLKPKAEAPEGDSMEE
uniref:Proteasome endopeptidase complex n=1 Tax=Ananas comosus var. bracteatus TaxID=296719 RepID=A0A6V7PGG3_ANACO|nr:unnamed protein product [Ananas comosus var. bracteatus]